MLRRTVLKMAMLPLLNVRFKGEPGLSLVDLISAIKNKQYYKLTHPPDQYIYLDYYYPESWLVRSDEFRIFCRNNYKWFILRQDLMDNPNLPEYVLTQKPTLDVELIEFRRKLDLVYRKWSHVA